jgi:hypothetical protein
MDDGRLSTPATPGHEVVLVGGGADLDMRASFLDGELIFWQHHDGADVLAAFLEKPFDARPSPRLIELSDHPYAVAAAAADAAGQICLVWPGQTALRAPNGVGLKASEILLR